VKLRSKVMGPTTTTTCTLCPAMLPRAAVARHMEAAHSVQGGAAMARALDGGQLEGAAREVMDLLDRLGKLGSRSESRKPMVDPFKELMEFVESEPVIKPEKEPTTGTMNSMEHVCLICDKTFDRVAKLSSHMKKAHNEAEKKPNKREIKLITAEIKESAEEKKVNIKTKDVADHPEVEEVTADETAEVKVDEFGWAELAGCSYQCLVCLAMLPWRRSGLEQHLTAHKLSLGQYHGVFGPAIQRQIAKEKGVKEAKEQVKGVKEAAKEVKEVVKEVKTTMASPRGKRPPQKPKKFECAICKEEFMWTEAHVNEHLKEKHCLTKEFYFSLYVKGVQSTEDKFNCDKCMFISTRKSALSFHTTKYHMETEKKSCCKKKFTTKWDLFVHLIENHKDDKDLFAKFDIWKSLEKYYVKAASS